MSEEKDRRGERELKGIKEGWRKRHTEGGGWGRNEERKGKILPYSG